MHLKELLWDAMGLIDLAQSRGKWRRSTVTTGIQWEHLKRTYAPKHKNHKSRILCTASKPLQLRAAITRDPEAAQGNSRVSYRLFCFRSSRGHTFQTRLTGSASVRQFDSADRRTTFRGFARLLKTPKSFNSISVSAARACRQCCCPACYPPARRRTLFYFACSPLPRSLSLWLSPLRCWFYASQARIEAPLG